jgi:hypothetical protein
MAVSPDDTDIQESRCRAFSQCTSAFCASQGTFFRTNLTSTGRHPEWRDTLTTWMSLGHQLLSANAPATRQGLPCQSWLILLGILHCRP